MGKSVAALTLLCAALLTSCADVPTKVVTVEKQVPVACVKSIPDEPQAPDIAKDADTEQVAAWLRYRANQLRRYAAELRALLTACMESK